LPSSEAAVAAEEPLPRMAEGEAEEDGLSSRVVAEVEAVAEVESEVS